jgi:hypothetical protein
MNGQTDIHQVPPLEHLAEPLEGLELLQLHLVVEPPDEHVGDAVDLVLQPELIASHRRAARQLYRRIRQHRRVRDKLLPAIVIVALRLLPAGQRRAGEAAAPFPLQCEARQAAEQHDGPRLLVHDEAWQVLQHRGLPAEGVLWLSVTVPVLTGAFIPGAAVAADHRIAVGDAAHDGVDLALDGAEQELLVAHDAEHDEARPQGARLGAHGHGPRLHRRDNGGEELLQVLGRLIHLSQTIKKCSPISWLLTLHV